MITSLLFPRQSTIVNPQSSIHTHQSTIINPQSSIDNHQSTLINRQSSIHNRQSTITNPQSKITNRQEQMPDFTLSIYRQLIAALRNQNYTFQCFYDFVRNPAERVIILRHDVDRAPHNALAMAELENSMGLRASYYFRIVPSVFEEHIIRKIASLGHEIGYH